MNPHGLSDPHSVIGPFYIIGVPHGPGLSDHPPTKPSYRTIPSYQTKEGYQTISTTMLSDHSLRDTQGLLSDQIFFLFPLAIPRYVFYSVCGMVSNNNKRNGTMKILIGLTFAGILAMLVCPQIIRLFSVVQAGLDKLDVVL